jgi:NADH:ubiquinone oxidoreductase subunit F (NADH-binding)
VALLDDVIAGRRPRADLALLDELEETLRLTSICGLGQVALGPSLSLRKNFP